MYLGLLENIGARAADSKAASLNVENNESLSQYSIKTIQERRNGIKSLLVCLSEYLHLCCVYILPDISLGICIFNIYRRNTVSHQSVKDYLVRLESKMAKLSNFMSKSQKVRMDYSRHGIYTCDHVSFSLFPLLSS